MSEILNVKCAGGRLIVTETHVILDSRFLSSKTVLRAAITAVDYRPPIFWQRASLYFHAPGDVLRVDGIKGPEAKQVRSLLTGR